MKREDIVELLPLYINGSLSSDDQQSVKNALADDPSLEQELVFLQAVKQSICEEDVQSPTEWGLSRLKKSIAEQEAAHKTVEHKVDDQTSAQQTPSPLWKKFAIAASFAFILQSAYVIKQNTADQEGYRTLSTQELAGATKVQFNDGTSEQEIRALLLNLQGNIVKGPSALGIYYVVFADSQKALTVLDESEIVSYAEQADEE